MASRTPLANGFLPLLCMLVACTAAPAASPTSLSGDDPWSAFASKWSPAVQAKINELKAQVQRATADADAARTQLQAARDQEAAVAQQLSVAQAKLIDEAPTEANIERRIASAEFGWQLAVFLLLSVVLCGAVYGHQRGAWALKFLDPVLQYLDPAVKSALRRLDPVLKRLEPALKALSPALKSIGLSEPLLFTSRGTVDEKAGAPGSFSQQNLAELERARTGEAAAKKHSKEVQAWAEANVAKAQADAVAARQALQEMQSKLNGLHSPMAAPPPPPLGSLGSFLPQPDSLFPGMMSQQDAMIPGMMSQQDAMLAGMMPHQDTSMPRQLSPLPVRSATPAGRPVKVRSQSPVATTMGPTPVSSLGPTTPSTPSTLTPNNPFQWGFPAADPWTSPMQAQAMIQAPTIMTMPNRMHLSAEPNKLKKGMAAPPGAFTTGSAGLV